MDDVREEVSEEEVVEKRHLIAVPPDFEDRANNDYDHDLEKVDKVVKILGETDKCCFCEYDCPSPSERRRIVKVGLVSLIVSGTTLNNPTH